VKPITWIAHSRVLAGAPPESERELPAVEDLVARPERPPRVASGIDAVASRTASAIPGGLSLMPEMIAPSGEATPALSTDPA
jgi:hypothetical protein